MESSLTEARKDITSLLARVLGLLMYTQFFTPAREDFVSIARE